MSSLCIARRNFPGFVDVKFLEVQAEFDEGLASPEDTTVHLKAVDDRGEVDLFLIYLTETNTSHSRMFEVEPFSLKKIEIFSNNPNVKVRISYQWDGPSSSGREHLTNKRPPPPTAWDDEATGAFYPWADLTDDMEPSWEDPGERVDREMLEIAKLSKK